MTGPSPSWPGRPFRVAAIGGGIGGLFCALALQHHCGAAAGGGGGVPVQVDVYEQAAAYGEIGAGIGLGVNAARVAARLGLSRALQEIAGGYGGVWMSFRRFDTSDEIAAVQPPPEAEPVAGQSVKHIMCSRSDLLDLLVREVRQRSRLGAVMTLHTSKACVAVEETMASHGGGGEDGGAGSGGPMAVRFRDGTTATADLVIGCDGIHSKVRAQFYHDRPVPSGTDAYRGIVPMGPLLEAWPGRGSDGGVSPLSTNMWVAKHRHLLTYPMARDRLLNVVCYVTRTDGRAADEPEEDEPWISACDRREIEADFGDFDAPVQRIIGGLGARVHRWHVYERAPVGQWHFDGGRVVLLGDAAHAMLPYLGAGAGQAFEDGWVLSRALADYLAGIDSAADDRARRPRFASLAAAMQFYQDVRLPRAQRVQAGSRAAVHLHEMQDDAMRHLSFEQGIPILAAAVERPFQRVFEEDVNETYEKLARGLDGGSLETAVL